jgi:hypothetical protein
MGDQDHKIVIQLRADCSFSGSHPLLVIRFVNALLQPEGKQDSDDHYYELHRPMSDCPSLFSAQLPQHQSPDQQVTSTHQSAKRNGCRL